MINDRQLRTTWQNRQRPETVSKLDGSLQMLMKHTLAKRVKQLGKLAEVWDRCVPEEIRSHTALESFSRGVLTVVVDAAPYRFQLETLLRGGLRATLAEQFGGPLSRIRLVPGQFASVDIEGHPRYHFPEK
jgi:hypothetical protein